jgi:hypothetical protein
LTLLKLEVFGHDRSSEPLSPGLKK